jgi:hypothetical protein
MKSLVILVLSLGSVLGAGRLAAAEEPGGEPAGGFGAAGEAGKDSSEEKKSPTTPIRRLLSELEAIVAREKARPEHDERLVGDLEELIEAFRKAEADSRPVVRLDDLSEEDRERLKEEVKEELAEERGAGDGGDWASRERARRVEAALEDVRLTDEQRGKVEEMLGEFMGDAWAAYRNGEVGLVNDLKKDLEKRLRGIVGRKKAKDIINNVNRQLVGRRR